MIPNKLVDVDRRIEAATILVSWDLTSLQMQSALATIQPYGIIIAFDIWVAV